MLELGEISSSAPWETEKWTNWHSFPKMVGNWLSQTCFLVLQVVLPTRLILTGFCFTPTGNRTWTRLEKQSKLSVRVLKELLRTCWVKKHHHPNPALFWCYCSFPIKNKIQKQKLMTEIRKPYLLPASQLRGLLKSVPFRIPVSCLWVCL